MKKKIRGVKRQTFMYDFSLYRVDVPIPDQPGHSLSVIDMNPQGAEQTIVFQHGYAGVGESWEFQINHFAREYRVIVPDLRGHGQSDAPYSSYTMPELVADLTAIVQYLKLPPKFILVGHSFGGSVCIEYANARPHTLEKLVLIATAGEYPLPPVVQYVSRLPTALFAPLWQYRPKWDAELHVMKRMMLNNLRKWKGWPLIRNITTPSLIITGERDRYFPRYVFDDVGKMLPGAEIYDVGSARHKVQLERHEAVNRALERFISGSRSSWRQQASESKQAARRPWLSHYSKDIPPTIPIPRQPLHRFLESSAGWKPRQTAVVFYGHTLTYEQLNARANQFARALIKLGVGTGDRVIMVLPNTPHFIIAYYAILKIGAVVVLPNPDADAPRIIHQTVQTQPVVLITLSAYTALARAIQSTTGLAQVVFVDIGAFIAENTLQQILTRAGLSKPADIEEARRSGHLMDDLLPGERADNLEIDVPPTALANINYTSGTTDSPKGVCLTHANLVANALQTRHWVPDLKYGEEVCLAVLPFLHSYGMTNAMNTPITIAAKIVILSVFELEQVLEHIKRYQPTIFPGVPSMYTLINQYPNVRAYGLSSIKACLSGAAPLPVEVQEAFEKLTRGRLVEGYGLTEAGPVTHANPLYGLRKVGSIGIPLPNTDARIVDLITGADLPPGTVGELIVRGPQVMQGYWGHDHDADPESVVRDGWLYTGDVAVMDDDGYFQIISRKRDTIMTGSYSVYPRDVEEVLYENNKVLEVAVVGVGQAEGEQKVKAYVVPRPGSLISKEELIELCRRRLEAYAVPWEIEFRETLPKSFIGKVLRRLLVEPPPADPPEA
ncbi:MAG: alpha/beta fold hydrolase [Anaerolineae bacterium]|nr:alpha/beta fold hydrolase [Anaerolineae bacterium]